MRDILNITITAVIAPIVVFPFMHLTKPMTIG